MYARGQGKPRRDDCDLAAFALNFGALEIRNPNKSHYPDIVALLHRCFEPAWEPQTLIDRVYFEPHYDPNHVWMAREAGQILGFMVTTLAEDKAWLKLLAVDPSHRRRGLARDLLSRAEFRLEGEGARQMRVESTPPFEFLPGVEPGSAAESLFAGLGYQAREFQAHWVAPAAAAEGKPFDKAAAARFAGRVSGEAWPWVEENIGTLPPRVVFRPGLGLALADPGQSVGPVWLDAAAPAGALETLSREALAIASTKPAFDAQGLRWYQVAGSSAAPKGVSKRFIHFKKTLA